MSAEMQVKTPCRQAAETKTKNQSQLKVNAPEKNAKKNYYNNNSSRKKKPNIHAQSIQRTGARRAHTTTTITQKTVGFIQHTTNYIASAPAPDYAYLNVSIRFFKTKQKKKYKKNDLNLAFGT